MTHPPDVPLDLLELVGLGMSLSQYIEHVLDGQPPYFRTHTIRFECTGCGACCERPGTLYLSADDVERIAHHLGVSVPALAESRRLKRDGDDWKFLVTKRRPCPFYDKNQRSCTVHEVKPWQCQAYPFWPENVCEEVDWRQEALACEGIGRGRVWSPDEILQVMVG